MLDKSKTYALSLEGGGFKGAYQAGAIKALKDEGIKFSAVVGTSIGAINGVFVALKMEDELEKLWRNLKLQNFFDIDTKLLAFKPEYIIDGSLGKIVNSILKAVSSGGMSVEPLKNELSKYVDEAKLRSSDIKYGLITVSLSDIKPLELMTIDIPKGEIINFIIASACFPGFKKQKISGKYYTDGGFYNNVPTAMLTKKGYKDIIEVRTQKYSITKKPKEDANIHRISTEEYLGAVMHYDKSKIDYRFKLGYYDALRLIYDYQGFDYYIADDISEQDAINRLCQIDQTLVTKLVNIENYSQQRLVLYHFVNRVKRKYKIADSYSYRDIYIIFLEKLASRLNIAKYQIYTFDEFIKAIKSAPIVGIELEYKILRTMLK